MVWRAFSWTIDSLIVRGMSALDPFYLVKEEIQDSANKLQTEFGRWERMHPGLDNSIQLSKQLLTTCESIEWQVEELDRAIAVAERNPARFSVDAAEIDRRRKWTCSTRAQVGNVKKAVQAAIPRKGSSNTESKRRELMRLPSEHSHTKTNQAVVNDNENFISNQLDMQTQMIKEQDQDLEDLSSSVERIGDVGFIIHEELSGQERLIDDLGRDVEASSNRLDFVQKKIEVLMKRAGLKGQIGVIGLLILLLLILIWLVFN